MAQSGTQSLGLFVYRLLVTSGAIRLSLVQRAFRFAYRVYKARIEATTIDYLHRYVLPGTTVMDIGANIGFFTSRFAEWVGPDGLVIAVEPDQANVDELEDQTRRLGQEARVQIHKAVATDRPGMGRLRRNELHPGDHRISQTDEGDIIPATTIDTLAARTAGRRVSFIKIDVQGAELLVLKGALETIRRETPTLFVEIDERALKSFGSSSSAVIALVAAEGYAMFLLDDNGKERPIGEANLQDALAAKGYVDVLFRTERTRG